VAFLRLLARAFGFQARLTVAIGVLLLPAPGVGTHGFKTEFG
jgi:hypothetical protein